MKLTEKGSCGSTTPSFKESWQKPFFGFRIKLGQAQLAPLENFQSWIWSVSLSLNEKNN